MKKAFTTAELLISLVIIGTIAMLVVPTFIKDYNMRVYSTSIKNIYNDIMNAVARACADSNVTYLSHVGFSATGNENIFLSTYLKGENPNGDIDDVFANSYKSLSGSSTSLLSEEDVTGLFESGDMPKYKLQNGVVMIMRCGQTVSGVEHKVCTFDIDTNGKSAPNIGGIDKFRMHIDVETNSLVSNTNVTCSTSPAGENCVDELIEHDWDMEAYGP